MFKIVKTELKETGTAEVGSEKMGSSFLFVCLVLFCFIFVFLAGFFRQPHYVVLAGLELAI